MTRILSGASLASTESCTSVSGLDDVVFMIAPGPASDGRLCFGHHPLRRHYTIFAAKLRVIPTRYISFSGIRLGRALSGQSEPGFHLPTQPHGVVRCVKSH